VNKFADIKEIDHSSAWNNITASNKLVIFCGSGVSLFAPSNFPTGQEILSVLVDSLKTKFCEYGFSSNNLDELRNLPLEYLVGLAVETMPEAEIENVTRLIAEYFCDIKPNRLHYLIASLLMSHRQCHVITTNYDIGIEQALSDITTRTDTKSLLSKIRVYSRSEQENTLDLHCNSIIKIHGCAKLDTPSDLVISTKQESYGLPSSILTALPELFENSLVVFMGYSISEPDCIEGLLSVNNYSVIWVDRDELSFHSNYRAKIILEKSTAGFLLLDLVPFIQKPIESFPVESISLSGIGLNHPALSEPFDNLRQENVNNGLNLYRRLIDNGKKTSVLAIVLQGLIALRKFNVVTDLLETYVTIPEHSKYWYTYWHASIVRDNNKNWGLAKSLFEDASKLQGISLLEFFEAKTEQLGLESLLFQRNFFGIRNIEKRIRDLLNKSEEILLQCSEVDKSNWLRITGVLQKTLVQNISYQLWRSRSTLDESLVICNKAIQNLYEGGDINRRIETERFLARIYYRAFLATKNTLFLLQASESTSKVVLLFSLLGINMGVVNSKRQYAHYLILQNNSDEALAIITDLKNMLQDSPDVLSQTKVIALEIILAYKMRKPKDLLRASFCFLKSAQHCSDSSTKLENVITEIMWFIAYIFGLSG
jgi:hypothetical protein